MELRTAGSNTEASPLNGALHDKSDLLEDKSKAGPEEVLLIRVLHADMPYRIRNSPKGVVYKRIT